MTEELRVPGCLCRAFGTWQAENSILKSPSSRDFQGWHPQNRTQRIYLAGLGGGGKLILRCFIFVSILKEQLPVHSNVSANIPSRSSIQEGGKDSRYTWGGSGWILGIIPAWKGWAVQESLSL